jgi:4-hydroxy-tetrahydrodipicolinate synthase
MLRNPRLTGCFTAITTPFTRDGHALDLARLAEQIAFQAAGGVTGIVVSGTTGESPTLSEAEYDQLVSAAVEHARKHNILVIAGTGSNSTHHAIELQKRAKKLGAHAALSVNPYYNKPGQEGLYRHFMAQADAADLPVVLYNIPARTGVALNPETIERLAAHPGIHAVKEATGSTDSCSEIVLRCPDLAVLSGDDSMTLPFASVGAVGVVSVASNLLPAEVTALCRAFLDNDWAGARLWHQALFNFCRTLFAETNPIPVKGAMATLGRDSGAMRLPMTEAKPETVARVLSAMELARTGLPSRGTTESVGPSRTRLV